MDEAMQEAQRTALMADIRDGLVRVTRVSVKGKLETVLVRAPIRNSVRIGRNQPCPCGSGRKNKKCKHFDVGL